MDERSSVVDVEVIQRKARRHRAFRRYPPLNRHHSVRVAWRIARRRQIAVAKDTRPGSEIELAELRSITDDLRDLDPAQEIPPRIVSRWDALRRVFGTSSRPTTSVLAE